MRYAGHLIQALDFLNDDEKYQVWLNGNTCLFTAAGKQLKGLLWDRDSLFMLSFACLNIGKHNE